MVIFNSYVSHYQRLNLRFPMVFLWFSYGLPEGIMIPFLRSLRSTRHGLHGVSHTWPGPRGKVPRLFWMTGLMFSDVPWSSINRICMYVYILYYIILYYIILYYIYYIYIFYILYIIYIIFINIMRIFTGIDDHKPYTVLPHVIYSKFEGLSHWEEWRVASVWWIFRC